MNERRRGEESISTGVDRVSAVLGRPQGPAPQPVVVTETAGEQTAPAKALDANQVVAFNFRAARKLRGWTQEEAARRLAPYLGQVLPKASISGIERSFDGERRRLFDAQELVAISLAFDLPVVWFLLPPPSAIDYRLSAAGRSLALLVTLLLGRDDQLDDIKGRMESSGRPDPNRQETCWPRLAGSRRS